MPDEDRDFYFEAFRRLSTTRQIGFATGPIPWDKIMHYADTQKLDDPNREVLAVVIGEMDAAYLAWLDAQADEERKRQEQKRGR